MLRSFRSETCQGEEAGRNRAFQGRECWERKTAVGRAGAWRERLGGVARVVRLGLRGCAEDFRPYPRAAGKLLRV